MFNSIELKENENLPINEIEFSKDLDIVVITEKPVKLISLFLKYFEDENEKTTKINVAKNYYISALIKIIETKFEIKQKKLIFNNKELEKSLTLEEARLKNNDIIFIKNKEE